MGLGSMVLQTTQSLDSRNARSHWIVLCQWAWGFPWLSFPSTSHLPGSWPLLAVIPAVDILWPKAAKKHFSWFPLSLFLIVCSGFPGHCSLVKLYHQIPSAPSVGSTPMSRSVPQGRAPAHHLNCKSNDLMPFAGWETTFFFLPIDYQGIEERNRYLSPTAYSLVIKKDTKKAREQTKRLPLSRP